MSQSIPIHPSVDRGVQRGDAGFSGSRLVGHGESEPVTVQVSTRCAHNDVCGFTAKASGALKA